MFKEVIVTMLKRLLSVSGIAIGMFMLLVTFHAAPAWAQDNAKTKPGWMEWGAKYCPTKPVRGGYMRAASPADEPQSLPCHGLGDHELYV